MVADSTHDVDPDEIAGRRFSTHFRGYDTGEVRAFLQSIADDQRALLARVEAAAAVQAKASELMSAAENRAAEVLREAQDEARRIVEAVAGERERAFAEGASRAEAVVAEAEASRLKVEEDARTEGERLVAEASAARHRVLDDLRRRRKVARVQVEQLNAAREKLLAALAEVRASIDATTTGLRDSLPEVKAAADAAARRVEAEDDPTAEQLEAEIDALKLAGLQLLRSGAVGEPPPAVATESTDPPAPADPAGQVSDEAAAGRRKTAVRIVRPMRSQDPATGLPEEELLPLEAPDPSEAVRIVRATEPVDDAPADAGVVASTETAAEAEVGVEVEAVVDAEPEPEPEVEVDGDPAAEAGAENRPSPEAVDALFARLKAGREERLTNGEAVLAEPDAMPSTDTGAGTDAEPSTDVSVHRGGGQHRDMLLARRDAAVVPATKALNRRLKRLLADEQNALLDRLRRSGTTDALPSAPGHDAAWAEAAVSDLALAAAAGAAFPDDVSGQRNQPSPDDLVAIAEALANAVAGPLRERLARVIGESDGDAAVAADAARATYRTWRAERLGPAIAHAVLDAFALGVSVAYGPGATVSWVVDDGGVPCSDAEDNSLAGALPCGEAFPTGHRRPPAHPGCRCVLVGVAPGDTEGD